MGASTLWMRSASGWGPAIGPPLSRSSDGSCPASVPVPPPASSTTRSWPSWRGWATPPASSSSAGPAPSPTAATPATRRRAPEAGATSSGTRAGATGLGGGGWGRGEGGGGGRATALTARVLNHFAVARPADLVNEIYDREVRHHVLAQLARVVQQARDEGDEVATQVLQHAAHHLVWAAR